MHYATTERREHKERLTKEARFLTKELKMPLVAVAGKSPGKYGWGDLATCDPDNIERQLKPDSKTGIGLVLGRSVDNSLKLIDLESDTKEGQQRLEGLIAAYGIVTASFTSGSERASPHFLFMDDGRLPEKAKIDVESGILAGVEVRRGGKGSAQSVLPPSLHPDSGREYKWRDGFHPAQVGFAELPEDFTNAICEAVGRKSSPKAELDSSLGARFARGEVAPEGQRNDALFKYACRRVSQIGDRLNEPNIDSEFRQDIYEKNQRQCKPPLDDHEVDKIIESALEYREEETSKAPTSKRRFKLTDLGNAERLVSQHGQNLRYCYPWGKWLAWSGQRWKVDDTGAIFRFAKLTVRSILEDAATEHDDDRRKALTQWSMQAEKAERIQALLRLAQSEDGIPILPSTLDSSPWRFNCQNGTIDLKTGNLLPHDRSDMLTKVAPTIYNQAAKCPTWMAFLDSVTDGDGDLVVYLQRLLGYSLTGSVTEHLLPILYGTGANGKSTFLNIVQAVFGPDYSMTAPPDLLMAKRLQHPTERADLFGKRFVAAIESEEGRRLAECLVKSLTGGDAIRARRMREDYWEFEPSHTLWMATNHKPAVRGDDKGIWRRLKLIPFTVQIPESKQDRNLGEKLQAELPGILRWIVKGCLDWQRHGLEEPPCVRSATSAYRSEQDVIGQFIRDRCSVGERLQEKSSVIYHAYKNWCDDSGERALSQTKFGTALTDRGYGSKRSNSGMLRIDIALLDDFAMSEQCE